MLYANIFFKFIRYFYNDKIYIENKGSKHFILYKTLFILMGCHLFGLQMFGTYKNDSLLCHQANK